MLWSAVNQNHLLKALDNKYKYRQWVGERFF